MLKLYEIRKEKGLTQENIAKILGVSRVEVSRYETGVRKLNHNQLIKLCVELNTRPDILLGFDEEYKKYTNILNNVKGE